MGGTYEEGHMLTFKIILLVSLGSAGDKQKNKTTAGSSFFQHQEKISTLSPFACCLVSNNCFFFRKMGSITHRASQKTLGGNLSKIRKLVRKHRKNCECCPLDSVQVTI